jgi:hypothetical protein
VARYFGDSCARYADLGGGDLSGADLISAMYNDATIWPDAFDPCGTGAQYDPGGSGSGSEPRSAPPVLAASGFGWVALFVLLVAGAALGLRQRGHARSG